MQLSLASKDKKITTLMKLGPKLSKEQGTHILNSQASKNEKTNLEPKKHEILHEMMKK